MSTAAREEWSETLRKQAEGTRETLASVWAAIDHNETCTEDRDDCPACIALEDEFGFDPRDFLQELPLELVWEHGEPFAVVLGVGGPHVEITGGGREGGYVLTVHWGGTHKVTGEAITRTGAYFRELVEQ